MKTKIPLQNILGCMLLSTLLLSACSLTAAPQTAPSPAAPTVDTALIKTNVAETVYAGLTQTALAIPTETSMPASATPLQSDAVPSSATPINTMTSMPISGTAAATAQWIASATPAITATPINKELRCAILSQTIANGKVMFPGESFEAGWTVENRGTGYWNAAGLDIVYVSGTEMQKGARYIDLPQSVPPTGNFSFSISMEAPGTAGTYETTWMLSGDPGSFCPMTVSIKVE